MCVGSPNPHTGYAGMFILVLGKLLLTLLMNRDLTPDQGCILFPPWLSLGRRTLSRLIPNEQLGCLWSTRLQTHLH